MITKEIIEMAIIVGIMRSNRRMIKRIIKISDEAKNILHFILTVTICQ